MTTIDTIRDILSDKLDIDTEKITEDLTFDELGIDSLGLVELIFALEDRLNIDFGEPDDLHTLGDVVRYVETLVNA